MENANNFNAVFQRKIENQQIPYGPATSFCCMTFTQNNLPSLIPSFDLCAKVAVMRHIACLIKAEKTLKAGV
jgi:hypothetical protein